MRIAPVRENEQEKLKTLNDNSVVCPVSESGFEDICRIISELCHSTITLISIIDANRNWYRSHHPLINEAAAAEFAFCTQAVHHPKEALIIADLHKDHRFENTPFVKQAPYAAFYAGLPLISPDGAPLGTLCIWDNKSRELDPKQLAALLSLSRQTATVIDLKLKTARLTQKIEEAKTAFSELDQFSTIAAHDIKSPLNAMISLSDLLKNNYAGQLDEEGNDYINYLHTSASNLSDLVTSVLNYSRNTHLLSDQVEPINFALLAEETIELLRVPANVQISYDKNDKVIVTNSVALKQILLNLLENAITHNDKEQIKIELVLRETPLQYELVVKDNGPGIPQARREQIFELFKRLPETTGAKRIGIGLAIVKKLTEKLHGNVKIESDESSGTTVIITLPK
jgi:signal transduction histidine kinase